MGLGTVEVFTTELSLKRLALSCANMTAAVRIRSEYSSSDKTGIRALDGLLEDGPSGVVDIRPKVDFVRCIGWGSEFVGVNKGEGGMEFDRDQAAMSTALFFGGEGTTRDSDRSGVRWTERSPPYICSTKSTSSSP